MPSVGRVDNTDWEQQLATNCFMLDLSPALVRQRTATRSSVGVLCLELLLRRKAMHVQFSGSAPATVMPSAEDEARQSSHCAQLRRQAGCVACCLSSFAGHVT
jgi:hypothetical protein